MGRRACMHAEPVVDVNVRGGESQEACSTSFRACMRAVAGGRQRERGGEVEVAGQANDGSTGRGAIDLSLDACSGGHHCCSRCCSCR